jgi:acyl carrier protein
MIPMFYQRIDFIPLTSNGKIDKKSLPNIVFDSKDFVSPNNPLEKEIFELCASILGYDNFGVTNNLLSIGFNSLSLLKFSAKLFEKYNIELNITDFNENNSIRRISKYINSHQKIKYNKHKSKEYYPLSPQQTIHYLSLKNNHQNSKMESDHVAYRVKIKEKLDIIKFKKALIKTIEVNSYIKTSFKYFNGKLCQKRNNFKIDNIKIHEKKLTTNIENEFIRSFNIFEAPLFRFEIYSYDGEIILLMDIHHLLVDNNSVWIFIDNLFEIYNDKTIFKEIDYFDYSLDSQKMNLEKIRQTTSYLKNQIKRFLINSKIDKITTQSFNQEVKFQFIPFNVEIYEKFCKKNNILISELFLATISLALSKFLKKDQLLIAMTTNGRDNPKYFNTFGYFPNMLPLFINIKYDNMKDYLNHLKESIHNLMFLSPYLPKVMSEINFNWKSISSVFINYNYITLYSKNNCSLENIFFNKELNIDIDDLVFLCIYDEQNKMIFLRVVFNSAIYSNEKIDYLIKDIHFFLKMISKS